MTDTVRVELPGGVVHDGARRTDAVLRPLTGADEQALQDAWTATPLERAEVLLARCVEVVGGRQVDQEIVRSLTIGDREALLWQLRRLTIGERLDAVVECPSCHEKLDVALHVGELLQAPYEHHPGERVVRVGDREVVLRAPTVADLAAVADAASGPAGPRRHDADAPGDDDVAATDDDVPLGDAEAGARVLLERCVSTIDGIAPTAADLDALRDAIERRIAELDPQAEALLTMRCPACDATVSTTLDAASFLLEEVARRNRHLAAEVHTIAWHYHWSEAEILGLPLRRRQRYLELIDDAVRGAP